MKLPKDSTISGEFCTKIEPKLKDKEIKDKLPKVNSTLLRELKKKEKRSLVLVCQVDCNCVIESHEPIFLLSKQNTMAEEEKEEDVENFTAADINHITLGAEFVNNSYFFLTFSLKQNFLNFFWVNICNCAF